MTTIIDYYEEHREEIAAQNRREQRERERIRASDAAQRRWEEKEREQRRKAESERVLRIQNARYRRESALEPNVELRILLYRVILSNEIEIDYTDKSVAFSCADQDLNQQIEDYYNRYSCQTFRHVVNNKSFVIVQINRNSYLKDLNNFKQLCQTQQTALNCFIEPEYKTELYSTAIADFAKTFPKILEILGEKELQDLMPLQLELGLEFCNKVITLGNADHRIYLTPLLNQIHDQYYQLIESYTEPTLETQNICRKFMAFLMSFANVGAVCKLLQQHMFNSADTIEYFCLKKLGALRSNDYDSLYQYLSDIKDRDSVFGLYQDLYELADTIEELPYSDEIKQSWCNELIKKLDASILSDKTNEEKAVDREKISMLIVTIRNLKVDFFLSPEEERRVPKPIFELLEELHANLPKVIENVIEQYEMVEVNDPHPLHKQSQQWSALNKLIDMYSKAEGSLNLLLPAHIGQFQLQLNGILAEACEQYLKGHDTIDDIMFRNFSAFTSTVCFTNNLFSLSPSTQQYANKIQDEIIKHYFTSFDSGEFSWSSIPSCYTQPSQSLAELMNKYIGHLETEIKSEHQALIGLNQLYINELLDTYKSQLFARELATDTYKTYANKLQCLIAIHQQVRELDHLIQQQDIKIFPKSQAHLIDIQEEVLTSCSEISITQESLSKISNEIKAKVSRVHDFEANLKDIYQEYNEICQLIQIEPKIIPLLNQEYNELTDHLFESEDAASLDVLLGRCQQLKVSLAGVMQPQPHEPATPKCTIEAMDRYKRKVISQLSLRLDNTEEFCDSIEQEWFELSTLRHMTRMVLAHSHYFRDRPELKSTFQELDQLIQLVFAKVAQEGVTINQCKQIFKENFENFVGNLKPGAAQKPGLFESSPRGLLKDNLKAIIPRLENLVGDLPRHKPKSGGLD